MAQISRKLSWPDCYNVRDLGGLPTADGKTTQFGRVVRSDIPARLTAEGRKAMWDYGIRTVLDLRTPWQTVEEPSNVTIQSDAPRLPTYLNISIETYKPEISTEISEAGSLEAVYCIMLDAYPEQIKLIMEGIATAREGSILLHCHAGKDRTGVVSALLLGLAGVSDVEICDDYAQSQACLWPLWEQIVAEAGNVVDETNLFFRPDTSTETIQYVIDHLTTTYGGIIPYLLSAGLSQHTLNTIRKRLVDA